MYAVDAWRADPKNAATVALVDAYYTNPNKPNTDLTPAVTAYKAASKAIGDAGYFDLKDTAWAFGQAKIPELQKYPTFDAYMVVVLQLAEERLVKQGKSPAQAQALASSLAAQHPNVSGFNDEVRNKKIAWMRANPQAALQAVQWGYVTSAEDISNIYRLNGK